MISPPSPAAAAALPEPRRRLVRPSDRRLADLAERTARSLDWSALRASSALWDKQRVRASGGTSSSSSNPSGSPDDFALYTRRGRERLCFMAAGSVACSLAEMRAILRATSDAQYAATMTELYGANFIYGAVVHRARSHASAVAATAANATANAKRRRGSRARSTAATSVASSPTSPASRATSTATSSADDTCDVLVKTATFVKPHLFARNEQWCFLDYYQPLADGSGGFVLAMSSLDPDDVFAGKTKSSVSQLQGVTAAYSVLPDPAQRGVRVLFYAQIAFDGGSGGTGSAHSHLKRAASKSTVAARLMEMAKAASRLPMIVRRRRLGAQVFADRKALVMTNSRCVCCARSLHYQLLKRKKKCHVCGYYVCEQCSVKQHMERSRVKLYVVRVCEHCLERVDEANYDNIPSDGASPPAIRASAPSAPPAGTAMTQLLRQSLSKSAAVPRKQAVMKVIKYLVDDDGELERELERVDEGLEDAALAVAPLARVPAIRLTEESIEAKYLRALATHLRLRETPLGQIRLANATSRKYPITFKNGNVGVPEFPVPEDEARRLELVRKQRLTELRNVPEMEIICALMSRELDCPTAIVTVMDETAMHVIAATEGFDVKSLPREEVFCAHTIMSAEPLLIPHPEADITYNRMNIVSEGGLRFYFGFPLKAADNTVLGTVCCFGHQSRKVSQAQFAVIEKLASVASRLLQARMREDAWRRVPSPRLAIEQAPARAADPTRVRLTPPEPAPAALTAPTPEPTTAESAGEAPTESATAESTAESVLTDPAPLLPDSIAKQALAPEAATAAAPIAAAVG